MSKAFTGMKVTLDRVREIAKIVGEFETSHVLVGIPSEKAGRSDGPLSNADLGYIHENGSAAANLPARPFLEPGVSAVHEETAAQLKEGAMAALDGDAGGMKRSLVRAGQKAADSVRSQFTNNDWAPLSEAALLSRANRHKYLKRKKNSKRPDLQKVARPLIDTGSLLRSVTFVIRRRKG